jgi:formate dehydrogenase maturation protein FdhE
MKLTMAERLARCRKNFWMWTTDEVVVKCLDCGRQLPIPYQYVCDAGGRVSRAKCESCQTTTCVPVLKDHKTVSCLEGTEMVILIDHQTGQRLLADTIMKERI